MIRLFGGGIVAFLLFALWIYCIFDVIATEAALIRNLPKMVWLVIVIFLPDIGSIAWLLLGRPAFAGWRPGDTSYRPTRRALGPEDLPSFPTSEPTVPGPVTSSEAERLRAWEDELRRREEELRRREDGDPGSGSQPPTE